MTLKISKIKDEFIDRIFELIKNIYSLQTEEKFNKKFKEIYEKELSYEFFNSLRKD